LKFNNQDQLLEFIKKAVSQRNPEEDSIAVFDADGTLWQEDANQILLDYQIEQEQKDKKRKKNFVELLKNYYQRHHRDKLCELFLKKQTGLSLTEFQSQSQKALSQTSLTVFPFQKELLKYLKKQGLKTVVITASIQWLVQLIVKKKDLPVDQVLGCHTELDPSDGNKEFIISDRIVKPSTATHSKAEIFLKEHSKNSCFLAIGNTMSDLPLLELAKVPVVVHSAKKGSLLFEKEQEMKQLALAKKWLLFEQTK